MSAEREQKASGPPFSAEAVGTLVAFVQMNGFEERRRTVLRRLERIRDSDGFGSLPDDLRERVREIVEQGER